MALSAGGSVVDEPSEQCGAREVVDLAATFLTSFRSDVTCVVTRAPREGTPECVQEVIRCPLANEEIFRPSKRHERKKRKRLRVW
jgi:hypothetical protein